MVTQQNVVGGATGHDDMYEAVFKLVGQQRNETYEDLTKVLPSIKDADPAELKELDARRALHQLLNPPKDPLREEYEKAAAEEDIDDLSTEDGDWIDASKPGKEDDEEVDENGIPIVKLSRASSGFVLDGPGDVKVDNFTPEADAEYGVSDGAGNGASVCEASDRSPAVAKAVLAASTLRSYVPTVIARAQQTAAAPAQAQSGAGAGAEAGASAGVAASNGPVKTLEDEIRAMSSAAARGEPAAQRLSSASNSPQQQQQGWQDEDRRRSSTAGGTAARNEDDEDAPEVVPEPSAPQLLLPPHPAPSASQRASADGGVEAGSSVAGAGSGAAAAAGALCGPEAEGPSCLPGECQDTSREDALWRSLQGVDGRALLEHMGLAGPKQDDGDDSSDDAELPQSHGLANGTAASAPPQQQERRQSEGQQEAGPHAAQSGPPALPNGHHVPGEDATSGSSGGAEAAGATGTLSAITRAAAADGAANATAAGSAGAAAAPTAVEERQVAAGDGAAAPAAGQADGGAGTAVAAAGGDEGRQLVPSTAASTGLAPAAGCVVVSGRSVDRAAREAASDGPTFEEVEAFSLDPDFDYDNVTLTPRAFPYSLLSTRWAPGAGGPAAAR